MKTNSFFSLRTLFLILALSPALTALCQIPQGLNYQAVAHTSSGLPLSNVSLQIKIGILSDTITPVVVYEELHSSVKTNFNGVFNLVIGTGVRQSGTALSFSQISWNASQLFLRVLVNYQGSWITMGNAKLWSVPYAMFAGDLAGSVKKLSVAGQASSNDDALFEVKNKSGQTVFAVYNEGVRVYVSDGVKGLKGGFAVGGFGTDKAESTKYMYVGKDSVRIYLDTNPVSKKVKGGFAVGGYDLTKGAAVEDYLQVTRDSTRIYVNDNPGKALKGGFAVGGFNATKGTVTPFTSLTKDNYFIGHESGIDNTTGKYNSFFGYKAGRSNTTGNYNVFIGHFSGNSNKDGIANLFIGDSAGYENTSGYFNVALGSWAGQKNKTGRFNVLIGANAGLYNITGNQNVNIGMQAGARNTSGSYNTLVGSAAGEFATEGSRNVFVGNLAGWKVLSGESNVYLGFQAGMTNKKGSKNVYLGDFTGYNMTDGSENVLIGTGSGALSLSGFRNVFLGAWSGNQIDSAKYCIFLGSSAGWSSKGGQRNIFIGPFSGYSNNGTDNVFLGNEAGYSETGSNKLYISNTSTPSPLIYGEFDAARIVINGNSANNISGRNFFVNGTAGGLYPWYNDSDIRLKSGITTIPDALEKVLQLRGVNFYWKNPASGMEGMQMGFIGQEAAEVIPEVVNSANDHYSMQYAPLTALLVEAIKEQQSVINRQQEEIERLESLKSEIDKLKEQVNKLIEQ